VVANTAARRQARATSEVLGGEVAVDGSVFADMTAPLRELDYTNRREAIVGRC
jgi:hypothetical protein